MKAEKVVLKKKKEHNTNLGYLKQAGCQCASLELFKRHGAGEKKRMCTCNIEANKREIENGGAWAAGTLGKPMNVENTRKLAKKSDEKHKNACEIVKRCKHIVKAEMKEMKKKEAVLDKKREALRGATQQNLTEYFETMERRDKRKWDDLALMASCLQLDKLEDADFPMKLVFLDKSGSMGFDKTSLAALTMGQKRAHEIDRGSCIVFLLAGPGETQLSFHRASDGAPPYADTIELGCSTWFNEPVFLVLKALASIITDIIDIDTASYEEPPVSVICLTDGMDNQTCQELRHLESLAEAINGIRDPEERNIYSALGSWKEADKRRMAKPEVGGRAVIPVWLVWCAVASGASKLLEQGSKSVAIVDATYQVEASTDMMDLLSTSKLPPLGAKVSTKRSVGRSPSKFIVTGRDEGAKTIDCLSLDGKTVMEKVDAATFQVEKDRDEVGSSESRRDEMRMIHV